MDKLKKEKTIKIDFEHMKFDKENVQKTIKNLVKLRKKADFFKNLLKVEIVGIPKDNLHEITNQYEYEINVAIEAIQIQNKKQRLEYLYDEICFYLDHVCVSNNLCEFKNDKCFVKRNTDVTMGCCHHYQNKKIGLFYQKQMIPCEYLGEKGCTTKAIGCKLFMCDEINKKGYKFTVYNVLLIRYFFNVVQKFIIKTGVFDTKENIIKRLMLFNF